MTVTDLYNVFEKNEYWTIYIADPKTGCLLGYCNNVYKWEDIHESIRQMEVIKISSNVDSLYVYISFSIEAAYQSEERCIMDGYEKIYENEKIGPIYAKKIIVPNPYNGEVDSFGYTFARIDGYNF